MTVIMGILRSQTSLHIPLPSFHHASKDIDEIPKNPPSNNNNDTTTTTTTSTPAMGIPRSHTDPLDKSSTNSPKKHGLFRKRNSNSNSASNTGDSTPTPNNGSASNTSSGRSSPRRKRSSELARRISERSTTLIPGFYHLAEYHHRFKMRHCLGEPATEEEMAKIEKMKKWDWKHATYHAEVPPPVGPMGEKWKLEGVALEQVGEAK